MKARLGVNIDHVATLRNARGEFYPQPQEAARACLENGADQITIHLREDRRHIRDEDVFKVKEVTDQFNRTLNLEIGCNDEIIEIAINASPEWICLVPEKREEVTTEGGLNLLDTETFSKIKKTCERLRQEIKDIKISLFLEPNFEILECASQIGVDAVEIHTGTYAKDFLENRAFEYHLESFKSARKYLDEVGIKCHAGHGLTDKSTQDLVDLNIFEEFNIGHWIIAESIFKGLGNVVRELSEQIKK